MKTLNALLFSGLVLLFTCGTALAFNYSPDGTSEPPSDNAVKADSESGGTTAPVPEPTTMVLLGTGLAALAVGARKRKK